MTRVGMIGLGRMGRPMAERLLGAGFRVCVWARRRASAEPLVTHGAGVAVSIEALAAEVECVLTCLPRPVDVTRVLTDVLRAARPGTLVIETSTIDPATSRRLAAVAAARRVAYVDAPVSGGPAGAAAGALTVMAGGEPSAVARARPVLEALGTHVHHLGPPGSGHLAKLCNQIITGSAYAAVAEALVLGVKGGLDAEQLLGALSTASGRSRTLEQAGPAILARGFEAQFTADLAAKDLDCALEAAEELAVRLPLAAVARHCYEEMRRLGLGELDQAAVIIPAERVAGVTVRARPAS